MKKVLSFMIAALLIVTCLAPVANAAGDTGYVSVSSATAAPGEEVTLTFTLTDSPAICTYNSSIVYDDDALKIVSVSAGAVCTSIADNGDAVYFVMSGGATSGTLFSVTFKILATTNGSYPVSVSFWDGTVTDENFAEVKMSVSAGTVTVKIPPCANHTWNAGEVTTNPTCTAEGVKTFTCSVCGSTKTESVAKADHTYEWVTTDPTCTEAGYKTGTCSVCKDVKTEAGEAATGHSYTWVTTAPTCTEAGYKTGTCSACGDVKTEAGEAATGHSYTWVTTAPTCTEDGYKTGTCSACGDVKTEAGEAAKGHTPSESSEVIKEATCTEKGLANGVCSVCGAKLDQYETPALGHDEKVETVPATCEVAGSKTTTCTRCDYEKVEEIEPKGHDYKVTEEVPATCEAAGSKTYVCVNDASHTYTEEIEALGHKWNSGMVTTPATCSTDGEMTYTCLNDSNHTKTEVIPATGEHDYTDKYEQSEDGKTHTGFCACGAEDEPAEHKYTEEGEVTVKPTATTEGEQIMYCVCGAETKVVLPKVDLDDVPKTGDITNQVVLTAVGMFSLIAAAAYVFKRKLAK